MTDQDEPAQETPGRFNPLSAIDPKSPDFAEDVMALAEAVIIDAMDARARYAAMLRDAK